MNNKSQDIQVSVIIPTYNRREWVQAAVGSALAQTGVSLECIVVDDGSDDNTGESIKTRYGKSVIYVWQENQGESAARNFGAELAKGKYLAFLDSDDLWQPEKLFEQVRYMEHHKEFSGVYCLASGINAEGKKIPRRNYGSQLKENYLSLSVILEKGLPGTGSSLMINRDAFLDVGGYDVAVCNGEDVDLCYQLLARGYTIGVLHLPLTMIRSHAQSQSLLFHESRFVTAYQDHLRIFNKLLEYSLDDEVYALVNKLILQEHLRMLLFYHYINDPDKVKEYHYFIDQRDPTYLKSSTPFYQQIAYYTPHLYLINQEQKDVLDFVETVFQLRDKYNENPDGVQDSLVKIKASVWCATRGNIKDWKQAAKLTVSEILSHPGIVFTAQLWRQVLRLTLTPVIKSVIKAGT